MMRSILAAAFLVAATAVSAQAQISDNVVKIGVLTDMSGTYADNTGQGSVVAAQMAVADFGGTVKGKPIQVIFADHQNKPDVGSAIANRWYDTENVDVIVDVVTTSVALAVQQITKEKNKVVLLSGPGSSELTGAACSPNGIHWAYDTYALSRIGANAMLDRGDDTWYFITADYTFGATLEKDAADVIRARNGKILGSVRHPLAATDYSAFLLSAQASGAKVIALADAGHDAINAVKQASEFGIQAGGQSLLALLMELTDVHTVGLQTAQGLLLPGGFYWDMNDETRAFSKRFMEKVGHPPSMMQAGVYSSVMHYLKAIDATGTDEAKAVIAKMKATPVNDVFAKNGHIREDGRMVHDMYLFQVKKPTDSKGPWDLLKVVATVPGDKAFRPLSESACPLVKKQ